MAALLRTFARDDGGNIATLSAVLMTVMMGFAAIAVDLGKMFVDRRKAQGAVDLAAIAAASDILNADRAARATVSRNGYGTGAPITVEFGNYLADVSIPAAKRFVASSAASANAIRVSLATTTPLYFGKLISKEGAFTVNTSATATSASLATFAIGSRLLSVNGGVLNDMLGAMLGGKLTLTAMDYRTLADARIDLFDFMNAAAAQAQITGPSYSALLGAKVKLSQVVAALQSTVAASGSASAARALSSVAGAISGNASKVQMGSLVDAGPYDNMPMGQRSAASVTVSALNLLSAAAQLANGQNMIALSLGASLPNVLGASVKLSVGERPVGKSWTTVGSVGAKVHTAQTRILLTVQLGGSGSIASVLLPIYVEVASGTAVVTSVNCNYANSASSSVTLGVQPGILDAWIGAVSDADMTNFRSAPTPPAASLVQAGPLAVTGRAHATISNTSPTSVVFSMADIQAQNRKTVSTTSFTSSLVSKLLADLQVGVGGVVIGGNLVGSAVATIISSNTAVVDQLLADTLATLGVGLGQADVWVSDLRCGGGVLVN